MVSRDSLAEAALRAWDTDELSSSCPMESVSTPHRSDPYWDGLFPVGGMAGWVDVVAAHRQEAAGISRIPQWLRRDPNTATEWLRSGQGLDQRLRVIGVLDSWRTATAEQVAAFTQVAGSRTAKSALIAGMFTAGVLDMGRLTNILRSTDAGGPQTVLRPSRTKTLERELFPHLTWPEYVATTGGTPVLTGGTYDRHNVLTAELGLRLAEYVDDVALCLGEKFCTQEMLLGSVVGGPDLSGHTARGDMAAVRDDGLRVVIETSTTPGKSFEEKAKSWAKLLSQTRPEDAGVFILFVTAERAETRGDQTSNNQFYSQLHAAVREHAGPSSSPTSQRMGIVSWREWFPRRHAVSEAFLAGTVRRPTGRGDDLWEPVDLWGSNRGVEQNWADPEFGQAVLRNANWLLGVPSWQRDPDAAPPLWPRLLIDADWNSFPVPPPRRDNPARTSAFGSAVGSVRAPQPPKRLRPLSP